MLIRDRPFNLHFLLAALACLGVVGCKSGKDKKSTKEEAAVRFYMEASLDGSDRVEAILVGRSHPFRLNVRKAPFVTEYHIDKAEVIDAIGGFSLAIDFTKDGKGLLEQYTAANKGLHMAIAARFKHHTDTKYDQLRWLAAPVVTDTISNGRVVFTPDATREEAERIATGLNRITTLIKKDRR
jgi:preprotein translocase subunit SecD